MNNIPPTPPPPGAVLLPTVASRYSIWQIRRRRPLFLVILLVALGAFIYFMPASERSALWAGINAERGFVLFLLFFALLTLSLVWSAGQRLDARVFLLFNTRSYPVWLDRSMWLLTQAGNMLTAMLIAILLYFLNYRPMAYEVALGTLLLWLLVESIKALADRKRPFITLEKTRVLGREAKGTSFPSGHTSQIFFLATIFVHHFQPGLGGSLALYAGAGLVGFTRIYVGAHYPRDVVAGIALGSLWGILTSLVYPY